MVGVCIRYFHENYGGMLQAFATTKLLEEMGIEYELIRYKKKMTPFLVIKFLPRVFNSVFLNDKLEALKKKMGKRRHPKFAANDTVRMQAFHGFLEDKFTKLSPIYYGYDELCKGASKYQAVITGSDQLWSPAGLSTNFYNLMFVPDDIRKVSYASSFGVKQIPWYQKSRTKEYLNRLAYISMRENRGSEIVQELTGKKVTTILDPVFMFDAAGWEKLVPHKKEYEEPYIFAYFLGENPEHRKAVIELAEKTGLKIVALRHLDQYVEEDENFGDFAPYDVSPEKFLNFIRGAGYVCTDSFHGSCFSIIHHKKFMVFNRYLEGSAHSKNSRIDTLCSNLGVEQRRFTGSNVCEIEKEINYDIVDTKIQILKEQALTYLNTALDGI